MSRKPLVRGVPLLDRDLSAPFPWFGGKRRVADIVWHAIGDVAHYIEPFAGSLACLLAVPYAPGREETITDVDHLLINFWRALQHDPAGIVEYANYPVTEADLTARHIWLLNKGLPALQQHMEHDPDFFDVKTAGWWLWGVSTWIGGEWVTGEGPWNVSDNQLQVGDPSVPGVYRKLPSLASSKGVHRRSVDLDEWMSLLSVRLRRVRVCCGDWRRVVTPGVLGRGPVGVFLDPPYDARRQGLYSSDQAAGSVTADVYRWAVEAGENRNVRVVVAGYAEDYPQGFGRGWREITWKRPAPYARSEPKEAVERLWLSPGCRRRFN